MERYSIWMKEKEKRSIERFICTLNQQKRKKGFWFLLMNIYMYTEILFVMIMFVVEEHARLLTLLS
jgi:hypothetical protein